MAQQERRLNEKAENRDHARRGLRADRLAGSVQSLVLVAQVCGHWKFGLFQRIVCEPSEHATRYFIRCD